ncbi:hypothetical protein HNO92_002992 [Chromobacterium alkanivorans]|uniref:hypothetical protein n=1 Tax=Chromobacterium TaxID=535 RepID=UPI000653C64E|nr:MULTISPECIES: hypothetical protein [Chromobacterium]KMN81095.1 hypothetical protein VK98_15475 [Chromobacterium sp. LK11]MBN3003072.1 hypothetical protein [Chromobacterium alkanivorans]MCS3803756.1 hypothetical protein [Chromobacterium alkanivorans]MCS3818139.1 hypothetical protein [Chromobacterium alkanivorans]MCS3874662.1 hypothetical protein [Chromobacterium alkanivorans]
MNIEEFFNSYAVGYSQLDVPQVTAHFTVPFTAIHQGDLTSWEDMASLRDTTTALLEWYRSQGFASARHQLDSVLNFGEDAASARVRWIVQRQGQPAWEYCTGYHLKRVDGEWKIYGLVQYQDAPQQ